MCDFPNQRIIMFGGCEEKNESFIDILCLTIKKGMFGVIKSLYILLGP